MRKEYIPFEKYMAAMRGGSREDAHHTMLDSLAVQITWNLKQLRAWMRRYEYKLTQEQRDVLMEVVRLDKEADNE